MANTFKFGNKQWYGKKGSVLAYNDENNNFKPLPFDFTRSSSATRVNKNGLIEVVGSDEPRVDYLNNADGHLLLEPSRTNLVVDSDDMAGWLFTNATIDLNSGTAPDGSNTAIKFKDNNAGGTSAVRLFETYTVSTSTDYEFSAFMKAGSLNYGGLRTGSFTTPSNGDTIFNLVDGTIHSQHSGHTRASIEDYGNGWYRCSIGFTTDASVSSGNVVIILANNEGNPNLVPVDGTSNILIWGTQFEQGSYATSYIPTSGSSVTRAAENQTIQELPNDILGSNFDEGTLYVEMKISQFSITRFISLVSGTSPNSWNGGSSVRMEITPNINASGAYVNAGVGSTGTSISAVGIFDGDVIKMATSWSGTVAITSLNGQSVVGTKPIMTSRPKHLYVDELGTFVGTGNNAGNEFIDIKIYDTALTESQLNALTS